MTNDITLA
ncbi:Protein of unknown function [Lactobacillus delbrueckii subsp. lactis]|nr:Protein of unknown function [Lactobacillus delbrueckii subsp. lactis]